MVGMSVHAQNSNQLKNQQRQIQKKINNTKTLIKAARSSKQLTMAEIGIINNQIAYREELIANINYQLRKTSDQISHTEKEIQVLESNLQKLKADYGKMLRYAYKNRNTDYKLMYIFSAESLAQAYKRIKYVQAYAAFRQKQAERIKSTQAKLEDKIAALEGVRANKETLAVEKSSEKEDFLKDQELQKTALSKIMADESRLKSMLAEQEKKKKRLTAEIRKAIKAELEAAAKKNNTGATANTGFKETPEIKMASKSFEGNKGKLPWPVEKGEITEAFGTHAHPDLPGIKIDNNGINIGTTKSSSVRAVFKGEVSSIIVIPGAGKVVMVKHGAYRTVYANLMNVFVSKGDKVEMKEELGELLPSGNISEAHFEIWKVSSSGTMQKQNPEYWIYKK